jgi:hypothetical protein
MISNHAFNDCTSEYFPETAVMQGFILLSPSPQTNPSDYPSTRITEQCSAFPLLANVGLLEENPPPCLIHRTGSLPNCIVVTILILSNIDLTGEMYKTHDYLL